MNPDGWEQWSATEAVTTFAALGIRFPALDRAREVEMKFGADSAITKVVRRITRQVLQALAYPECKDSLEWSHQYLTSVHDVFNTISGCCNLMRSRLSSGSIAERRRVRILLEDAVDQWNSLEDVPGLVMGLPLNLRRSRRLRGLCHNVTTPNEHMLARRRGSRYFGCVFERSSLQ
jgi:hypothetical protein